MSRETPDLLEAPPDFGDKEAEYRSLLESCALVSRADRAVVRVAGERRAEMLNGLLTNQVTDLEDTGRHAMLLTPKGRVLTDLRVFARSDHMLLDVPRSGLRNLLDAFRKYLPPLYATFEDASDALHQLGLYGPEAAATALEVLGTELPEDHLGVREIVAGDTPVVVIRDRLLAPDGVELIVPDGAVARLTERLLAAVTGRGGRASGSRALEVVRVEWGIPSYGIDISDSNLAQETGLEDVAISHDKGCYLGQEVVARVHFRGHVNRRLRSLRFANQLPTAGANLYDERKDVGVVTSRVVSPEFGPIGLGYVRREVEPPAALRWADREAEGGVTVLEAPLRSVPV